MKFSGPGFVENDQSNALDLGYQTVIHRHDGQKWKYPYPRHIRPHFSSLSRQEKMADYPMESQVMVSQGSEDNICPISAKPPETLTINEVNKIHLQNVCQNLKRRLEAAQLKGDQWLISLLEKEVEEMGGLCVI